MKRKEIESLASRLKIDSSELSEKREAGVMNHKIKSMTS